MDRLSPLDLVALIQLVGKDSFTGIAADRYLARRIAERRR